jgi:hypothetical protein
MAHPQYLQQMAIADNTLIISSLSDYFNNGAQR